MPTKNSCTWCLDRVDRNGRTRVNRYRCVHAVFDRNGMIRGCGLGHWGWNFQKKGVAKAVAACE